MAITDAIESVRLQLNAQFFINYAYEGIAAPADVFLSVLESGTVITERPLVEIEKWKKLALRIVKEIGSKVPVCYPSAMYFLGRDAWLSGKVKRAHRLWARGVERAESLEMSHEAGRILLRWGNLIPSEDLEGQDRLKRAADHLKKSQANYYLAMAESTIQYCGIPRLQ